MYRIFYSFMLLASLFIFSSCNDDSNNDTINTTKGTVTVLRDKDTKAATFIIDGFSKDWKIYAGKSINTIDKTKPILEGNQNSTYKLDFDGSTRSYFQLVTSDQTIYFAETHLPMAGGYNYRDLGGIKTKDNKIVKWGKIFRSDDFTTLTVEDLTYLSSIPIITHVDFRSPGELAKAPGKEPYSLKNKYELSISPGNLDLDLTNFDVAVVDSFMQKMNLNLVSDTLAIAQYQKFFELLQNEENLPLIYNCSAGKDRTGMASALILYSLGVDEKIIFENYLESNIYLADKYKDYITVNPLLKSLFEVKMEFINTGIDYIKKNYGSVENYLVKVLHVDLQKMKDIYLY